LLPVLASCTQSSRESTITVVPKFLPGFELGKHVEVAFAIITGEQPITAKIRFRGPATRYATERKIDANQTVTPGRGGSTEITATLSSTIELKSDIVSFGPAAEVIEPQSLLDEMETKLTQAIAH
jgi:predicted DNA-binding transcriptional regulator YafY